MQELGLFVTLAEIAGVFVGFGALISVRSSGTSGAYEVTMIRSVLAFGMWVVVAGITPLVLGGYDISGHELWLACSLVAIVLFWGIFIAEGRTPENRAAAARITRGFIGLMLVGYWPFVIVVTGALILVVLGLFPDREPALYLTAVAAGLFAAGSMLYMLVVSQGRPTASDEAELPAAAGSSD